MLDPKEKKESIDKAKEFNKVIRELRSHLNEVNALKEKAFQKKEELAQKIRDQIGSIKDSRSQRDSLSSKVREAKKQRNELNNQIKAKIEEAKKLNDEKKKIQKKFGIKNDPSRIKEEIDKLEIKVETEVMSFSKEKSLMKTIKDLKKNYEEVKAVSTVFEKIHKVNSEIKEMKKKADQLHRVVQDSAVNSQSKHEEMIVNSKEIDDLKEKEKDLYNDYLEKKKEFTKVNKDLKDKLSVLNDVNRKLDTHRKEVGVIKKEKEEMTIAEKKKEVEEKIQTRKKLTTEDLLILQRKS